jgi:hypothetical protein
LRGEEILFRTDGSLTIEPKRDAGIARGISADGSPVYAEVKWIENVQAGDYFFICSRGLRENLTDDDIKILISQNNEANIDPAGSLKQLADEKKPGNYSMYLVKVNTDTQKRVKKGGVTTVRNQNIAKGGVTAIGKQNIAKGGVAAIWKQNIAIRGKTIRNSTPLVILAMTVIGMLILFIYFRHARPSAPPLVYTNQTTPPADVLPEE